MNKQDEEKRRKLIIGIVVGLLILLALSVGIYFMVKFFKKSAVEDVFRPIEGSPAPWMRPDFEGRLSPFPN
jgi:flagellar basal body-associated protein FliL